MASTFSGTRLVLLLAGILLGCSVAAHVGIPAAQRSQREARARQTVADLQDFAAAFADYAHQHGNWPDGDTRPGVIPPGLTDQLSPRWQQRTPIGGHYVWLTDTLHRGQRFHAAIAVASAGSEHVTRDRRQIEALFDAASAAGLTQLRSGFRNEPFLALE